MPKYEISTLSGSFRNPFLFFKIDFRTGNSDKPITWVTSGLVDCTQLSCELKCYQFSNALIFNSRLRFSIMNNDSKVSTKSAIILIDYHITNNGHIIALKEDIVFEVFPTATDFFLTRTCLGSLLSVPTTYLAIYLKFVRKFDYTSALYLRLGPPSKAPFFNLLNSKDIPNVSFKLQGKNQVIWVSKQIICRECAFFDKMLQKEWRDNADEDDNHNHVEVVNWSDQVLIAIILHLYTGWLPGTLISKEVFVKLLIEESDLVFDSNLWLELYETADMLELSTLAFLAAIEAKKCISAKIDNFLQRK